MEQRRPCQGHGSWDFDRAVIFACAQMLPFDSSKASAASAWDSAIMRRALGFHHQVQVGGVVNLPSPRGAGPDETARRIVELLARAAIPQRDIARRVWHRLQIAEAALSAGTGSRRRARRGRARQNLYRLAGSDGVAVRPIAFGAAMPLWMVAISAAGVQLRPCHAIQSRTA